MSMIDHYDILFHNPVIVSEILEHFFAVLGKKEKSILLAYLVLPISMSQYSNLFLRNSKPNSSLLTFLKKNDRLIGLSERIYTYWQHTSLGLQYALAKASLRIDDDLAVVKDNGFVLTRKKEKEAEALARFFQPYDVVSIYRMLGVKSL